MKAAKRYLQRITWRPLTRWLQVGLGVVVLAAGGGCATSSGQPQGRVRLSDGRSAPVTRYTSTMPSGGAVQVDSLLVLPPFGRVPDVLSSSMHRALQARVEKMLPGTVLAVAADDPMFSAMTRQRMLQRNGRLDLDAVAGIGRLAQVSHVLAIRLVETPTRRRQAPAMEWVLVATQTGESVVVALGTGG